MRWFCLFVFIGACTVERSGFPAVDLSLRELTVSDEDAQVPVDDLAGLDLYGVDLFHPDLKVVADLKKTSDQAAPADMKPGADLASVQGTPSVGQCYRDSDCAGAASCSIYFPGGRCLGCVSCPDGTTCDDNQFVCTTTCDGCGAALNCASSGGNDICALRACNSNAGCPLEYECRVLDGSPANSTKYCQRWKCTGTSDTSCPGGTRCALSFGSTYVCIENNLFP